MHWKREIDILIKDSAATNILSQNKIANLSCNISRKHVNFNVCRDYCHMAKYLVTWILSIW